MDGLKGYVALVSGLTEATAARAREVATALLAQGGIQAVPSGAAAMATQITGLAEDLLVTARDNRGALLDVVRTEAERAVATLGVVTAAEADALRSRIAELEAEIAGLRASAASAATATSRPTAPRSTATKARATKATGTKTTATKVTATKVTAKKATAKKATAKKAAPRKATAPVTTPAKKSAATTAAATKATTSAASKATPRTASAKKAAPRKAVAPTTTVADTTTSTGDESA